MLKVKEKKLNEKLSNPKSDSKMLKVSPIKTRYTSNDSERNGLKIVSDSDRFPESIKKLKKKKKSRGDKGK